ncbi:unnamed protein product [Parnassius apollo]|uniref:(apollo) hypothetical protein n=1 Tax=Parnassius apollo TaxID=110799 RepID=A0A8S3XT97_PARAO|nr:unnamed protein product [Parnassius apollo]
MADLIGPETIVDDEVGYEYDTMKIPEIVTPDEMNESGYQEGSETSYGDRRDSKEGFGGRGGIRTAGWTGVSSGCSTVDDCPVVSINDVVAYYDDIRPRRRHVPQLNFYHVDIERMALDAVAQHLKYMTSLDQHKSVNLLYVNEISKFKDAAFSSVSDICIYLPRRSEFIIFIAFSTIVIFVYGSEKIDSEHTF